MVKQIGENRMSKELWELKHRPATISEYVFQDPKQKQIIEKFIEEQSIPHLLLSGHRGTGKTSLAMILKNELGIDDSDFLEIKGPRENDIDTMRNKILGFISTFAMSQFKIVFIDEADRMSIAAQDAAKSMLEEYADNARFILTSNKAHKITPELKSRCFEMIFKKSDRDDYLERLAIILRKEKVKADLPTIEKYVEMAYPDLRKAIQLAQANIVDHKLVAPNEITSSDELILKVITLMEKNEYLAIRDVLSSSMTDDDIEETYQFLYETLEGIGKFSDVKKWKAGIVIIADHLYKHDKVAHADINAMHMFIRLGDV